MKGKDNIAFSVDFGSSIIEPENQKQLFEYAKNFKYISFRNIFKLDYIKDILKRDDACTIIDSVFLLDEADYLPYVKEPKIKEDYVFVYNCKENNPEMVERAKKFAKENNLKIKIVNCFDKNYKKFFDGIPTPISIEEYLGLIKSAKYIFTNSYHGICFSIIFKKNFYAFSRISNNEKILILTELFGLNDRYVADGCLSPILKNEIDYEKVYVILKKHQKEARDWLKHAVGV